MELSYGNRRRDESTTIMDGGCNQHDARELVRGMSQSDFMLRQRYVENSGYKDSFYQSVSVASNPFEPSFNSSDDVRQFVLEQRKIIANFRAQPWPMKMKMAARKAYRHNLTKYTQDLNTVDTFRDLAHLFIKKMKRKFFNFIDFITIWGSMIKQIEGHFGSSVASFFIFLRWMCALNLILLLMVFGFLVIPQALGGHGLDVPASVRENGSAFSFIIDGTGYKFEYSVLFYGFYDSGQNEPYSAPPRNPAPYIGWGYRLPLAYLLSITAMFIVSILITLFSMAKNYKILQRANVSEQYLFAWKIFASWDHTITNKEMVSAKARQIIIILKESIIEADKVKHERTKCYIFIIRLITQIIVLVILVASSYAIYLAVEESRSVSSTETLSQTIRRGWGGVVTLLRLFQVQLVVNGRNLALPFIFRLAEIIEKHHPRTQLKIMLIRLCLLYVTSLYVVIIALLAISQQCEDDNINNNSNTTTQSLFSQLDFKRIIVTGSTRSAEVCCWETIIGQELFKLSITHFLAELFSISVNDALRWAVVQSKLSLKFNKLIGKSEFKLAENVLRLVYGQALVWLGVLFCPLILLVNFMKIVLLFYLRAVSVSIFNRPPRTMFRIANARNFYMAILLVLIFLCLLPVGYAVIRITPSTICGPFRGLSSMWKIVVYEIDTWPNVLLRIIEYIQTATIVIPGIALLFIAIFYYMTLVGALKEVNKDLQLQLHMEQNEIKERIVRDVEEQSTAISPVSMKHRHKQLVMKMNDIEQLSATNEHVANHFPSIIPSHSPPILQSQSPSVLPSQSPSALPNRSPYHRQRRVTVREIDDDDDVIRNLVACSTDWSPPHHNTTGYVDNNRGTTVRQTTL